MPFILPEKCLRGRDDCLPLAQIASDCGASFFCCGENDGSTRSVEQDNFRLCFKGEYRDEMSDNDRRDLTHLNSVIAQAIAITEPDYDPEGEE